MIRNNPYLRNDGPLVGLVTTPIGNIDDITLRAVKFLTDADIIACEDTRNTGLLLARLNIKPKKLVSLYAQTELKEAKKLVSQIKQDNLKLAYCSDAGMPGISDPGALLVQVCYEENVPVTILPGPNAALSALVISGIDSADFCFYGFLPTKAGQEKTFFSNIINRPETMIFYESPKRILKTLAVMKEVFGNEREVSLIRELTKIHEEVIHGTLKEIVDTDIEEKGECVIILKGSDKNVSLNDDQIKALIKKELKNKTPLSSLSKQIAEEYNISKNLVYKLGLELTKN